MGVSLGKLPAGLLCCFDGRHATNWIAPDGNRQHQAIEADRPSEPRVADESEVVEFAKWRQGRPESVTSLASSAIIIAGAPDGDGGAPEHVCSRYELWYVNNEASCPGCCCDDRQPGDADEWPDAGQVQVQVHAVDIPATSHAVPDRSLFKIVAKVGRLEYSSTGSSTEFR